MAIRSTDTATTVDIHDGVSDIHIIVQKPFISKTANHIEVKPAHVILNQTFEHNARIGIAGMRGLSRLFAVAASTAEDLNKRAYALADAERSKQ